MLLFGFSFFAVVHRLRLTMRALEKCARKQAVLTRERKRNLAATKSFEGKEYNKTLTK